MDDKKDINIIDNEKDTKNEINNKEMNSNEISIEIKKIDKVPDKEIIDKIKGLLSKNKSRYNRSKHNFSSKKKWILSTKFKKRK